MVFSTDAGKNNIKLKAKKQWGFNKKEIKIIGRELTCWNTGREFDGQISSTIDANANNII